MKAISQLSQALAAAATYIVTGALLMLATSLLPIFLLWKGAYWCLTYGERSRFREMESAIWPTRARDVARRRALRQVEEMEDIILQLLPWPTGIPRESPPDHFRKHQPC